MADLDTRPEASSKLVAILPALAWYRGSRPRQRPFGGANRPLCEKAETRATQSPCCLTSGVAGEVGTVVQLPIDDIVDERDIVHDCEMGTLADVDLQT